MVNRRNGDYNETVDAGLKIVRKGWKIEDKGVERCKDFRFAYSL